MLQAYSAVMMTVSSPCVKGLIEHTFVTRDTGRPPHCNSTFAQYVATRTTPCIEPLRVVWFPRGDPESENAVPLLGTVTTAITAAAIGCGAVNRGETGLPRNDPTMAVLRNMCLDRRRGKYPVSRRSLSMALCRARQAKRQKQADSRFKRLQDWKYHRV